MRRGPAGPQDAGSIQPLAALEIVCDESGFAGGNLVGPGHSPVFAHASIAIGPQRAADLISALRLRARRGPGELKAARLTPLREADATAWLLNQPDLAAGRARVHLTDTRLFVLARTVDVLLTERPVVGIDVPGDDPELRELAVALHRALARSRSTREWHRFLVAAANLLRTKRRWLAADPLPGFAAAVEALLTAERDPQPGSVLRRLYAARFRAEEVRKAFTQDRHAAPLMEPLLPALMCAIQSWGAQTDSLTVVHDEQSALTRWRVAEMAARLAAQPSSGRLVSLQRVDSREDPRVQVADLLAGLARHWALATLAGRTNPTGTRLRPLVDPRSVWCP